MCSGTVWASCVWRAVGGAVSVDCMEEAVGGGAVCGELCGGASCRGTVQGEPCRGTVWGAGGELWVGLCGELGGIVGGTVLEAGGNCGWDGVRRLWGELVGAVRGELCGWVGLYAVELHVCGAVWWDCMGSCVRGAVWVVGGAVCMSLCGACTPITRWSRHTHTIASSTPSTRGVPHYPLTSSPHPAPAPCSHPQQQPGSPLQSVPTSPTACSSACAPSSSLSR